MARVKPVMTWKNNAEVLAHFGGIAPERICFSPLPGLATEKDLTRLNARKEKLYELVDGTLVEKIMGYREGFLAADIIRLLGRYLDRNDLGDLGGADATMRLMPGLVRIPDVSL